MTCSKIDLLDRIVEDSETIKSILAKKIQDNIESDEDIAIKCLRRIAQYFKENIEDFVFVYKVSQKVIIIIIIIINFEYFYKNPPCIYTVFFLFQDLSDIDLEAISPTPSILMYGEQSFENLIFYTLIIYYYAFIYYYFMYSSLNYSLTFEIS